MQRWSQLDGLRGMLAVYVMVSHACMFAPVPGWLAGPFSHGEAIVDLFFALSGLVVVNSLERFDYRPLPFLKARAKRLLPVYFTVLALAVVLICLGSPLAALPWLSPYSVAGSFWRGMEPFFLWHVVSHVFLIQGLLPHGFSPWGWITVLPPAWSLSTEWQFYMLMAFVLGRLGHSRRLEVFAFLILAIGMIYHAAIPVLPGYWRFSRAFLPDAAPYFALGLASAIWMRGGGVRAYGITLAVVVLTGLLSGTPGKALTPIGWTVLLLAQRHPGMPLLPPLLGSRAAQYMGAISYPLYLVNEPVQRACAMLLAPCAHGSPLLFSLLWLPAAVLLPIPAAIALHVWVEKAGTRRGGGRLLRWALPVLQPRAILTR